MECVECSEYTTNQRSKWVCPLCIACTKKGGDNTITPTGKQPLRESSVSPIHVIENGATAPQLDYTNISVATSSKTLDQFGKLLDSKLDTFRQSIKNDINDSILKLKDEFTTTTDFLALEQNDINNDIKVANKQINQLERERASLVSNLSRVSNRRVNVLEKASRCRNLEIQMVPENRNKNLNVIFKKMCDTLKLTNSDYDLISIRRIAKMNPASDRPRSVLVSLSAERHRDNIISAFKRYNKDNKSRPLNNHDQGIGGQTCNVYVAEHLAPEIKELHNAARQMAKQKSYRYVWVKYGRVYVRKDDNSNAINISDTLTLNKLV